MLAIQILGVSGHPTTNALKINTFRALKELNLLARVEEVSDIDHLVTYDIAGVPAMVINGQLRFQQSVPDVDDLKLLIKLLDKPFKKKSAMKNILVPSDFSKAAADAFRYAQDCAPDEAHFTVMHAYHPQIDPAYPYIGTPSQGYFENKKATLTNWAKAHFSVPDGYVLTKTTVDTDLKIAGPERAIVASSKTADLVVMGGTGERGFLEQTFGSTATFVAQNAHCPVLLVPEGYAYGGFKKVLYASNAAAFDESMLQQLVDTTWDHQPEISLVHVNESSDHRYEVVSEEYEQYFRERSPHLGLKFVKIDSAEVIAGLQQYAEENDIDLIVMATRHRNWLENIMHQSQTKKMIRRTNVPLLVLHPER